MIEHVESAVAYRTHVGSGQQYMPLASLAHPLNGGGASVMQLYWYAGIAHLLDPQLLGETAAQLSELPATVAQAGRAPLLDPDPPPLPELLPDELPLLPPELLPDELPLLLPAEPLPELPPAAAAAASSPLESTVHDEFAYSEEALATHGSWPAHGQLHVPPVHVHVTVGPSAQN